jgi:DNA-binding GntR family transcriptional regulator
VILTTDPLDLFAVPRHDSLARQVYTAVRRAIRAGELVPNRWYSEQQLATLFDVSRTPVREALIELSREGAVERVPQRGFRLRVPSASEIEEDFDLRSRIESYVVEKLVTSATDETLERLRALVAEQEAAAAAGSNMSSIGNEFHLALPAAAGLWHSYRMLLMLRPAMWPSVHGQAPDRHLRSVAEHARVLELIEARDAVGALAAIQDHIASSQQAAFEGLAAVNAETSPAADGER